MKSLPAAFSLLPLEVLIIVEHACVSVRASVCVCNELFMNGSYWLSEVYTTGNDGRTEVVRVSCGLYWWIQICERGSPANNDLMCVW